MFLERILIDTQFIDNAIEEAEPFIKLALLPELVGKWFSRQTVATSITQPDPIPSTCNDGTPTTSSSNDSPPTTSSSNDSPPTTSTNNDRGLTSSTSDNACTTTASTTTNDSTCNGDTEVWCFCKQGKSYGDMIGCDNPQCAIQWFHLSCLKLEQHQVPGGYKHRCTCS